MTDQVLARGDRLIPSAIKRFELDVSGLVVMTEADT